MNIAYIKNGKVIVIAPPGWNSSALDYDLAREATGASVGDIWDGVNFIKAKALPVEPLPSREFMRRFTITEWIGIKAQRAVDPMVDYVMSLFEIDDHEGVRLNHPDTIAGLAYFVHEGLLTQERADEILTPVL